MYKTLLLLLLSYFNLFSQEIIVNKIEPANWWTKMKTNKIQLMVYGKNLSQYTASFNTKSIHVEKVHTLSNNDYSFIDIKISSTAKEGNYKLSFKQKDKTVTVNFPLYKRDQSKLVHKGFGNEDVIYLIMPDRFSDGDPSNNEIDGMINDYKPNDHLGRHGGDLQGVINHLNYFSDLGVSALWLTPILENNKSISYHGYAATDLYKVDGRFGNNDKYKELVTKAHAAGLKIIYDHVSNHIGTNHPWIDNPPMPDWLNGTKKEHLTAWHDKMVEFDIHGSKITNDHLTKGWFVDDMADLNQQNNYVKNYLIQNTIWWIESAGIDGIREDTYPYADANYLSEWAKKIMEEYPRFNIVGEVWTGETSFTAAFQKNSKLNKKYNSNLPVVTDFAIQNAYSDFLEGKSDLYKIYETTSKDFLYENPNNILTFADNHDIARIMFTSKENVGKVKLVLAHLLTARGIPQMLYGTEIGMVGNAEHGYLRSNFPGGFPGDKFNAFVKEGRNDRENDIYDYVKKLLHLRKSNLALSQGSLQHLPPIDSVYIYSKKFNNETVLVALNGSNLEKEININLLENFCGNFSHLIDMMNNANVDIVNEKIILQPLSGNIFSVKN